MKFQINIPSICRPVRSIDQHIHTTLRHLLEMDYDGVVNVFAGSPMVGYLADYKNSDRVLLRYSDRYPASGWSPSHRANWNFVRCFANMDEDTTHLMLMEDDVQLAKGWYSYLQKCIALADERHGSNYVLTLYVSHTGTSPLDSYREGRILDYEYQPGNFCTMQAVVFPRDLVPRFHKHVKHTGLDHFNGMNCDRIVGRYMAKLRITLVSTAPCLAQHIGKYGSGAGGVLGMHKCHTTKSFVPDVT